MATVFGYVEAGSSARFSGIEVSPLCGTDAL